MSDEVLPPLHGGYRPKGDRTPRSGPPTPPTGRGGGSRSAVPTPAAGDRESLFAQVLTEHRVLYRAPTEANDRDHPYKRPCTCGAWSYDHEAHVARELLAVEGRRAEHTSLVEQYGTEHRWFAWRPVWTRDRGWRWLRVVKRRRIYVDIVGEPAMAWFIFCVEAWDL